MLHDIAWGKNSTKFKMLILGNSLKNIYTQYERSKSETEVRDGRIKYKNFFDAVALMLDHSHWKMKQLKKFYQETDGREKEPWYSLIYTLDIGGNRK